MKKKQPLDHLDAQIRDHIERETADNIALGMTPADAHAAALRKFGNTTRIAEDTRDVWRIIWLEQLWQDIRFAIRQIRRRPGFTALAVSTLGFGIGATTAVYTVVHAVLLQSAYQDANRLVIIWDNQPVHDKDQYLQILASPADFEVYRQSIQTLEHVALASRIQVQLEYGGITREYPSGMVTTPMLRETLGVEAALGRTFQPSDERNGCAVVLAHSFWSSVLGANEKLVGQALNFDKAPCTVLGVMPPEFTLFPVDANMWFLNGHAPPSVKYPVWGGVCGRMKPGVGIDQVQAEIITLHKAANANRPPNGDREVGFTPTVDSLQSELTALTNTTLESSLWLTLGAVSLLLAIACLNVASLLLSSLSERRRELVVRAALGSGRLRLIRQVLTESMLLSTAGAIVGAAFATLAVWGFRALNPAELPPHAGAVGVNLPVLLFAVTLSCATALVFGLLPALQASRIDLSQGLKAAGRGFFGTARRRPVHALIAVEVALSFVLLIGSGLLQQSVFRMGADPLGFDPNNVIALDLRFQRFIENQPGASDRIRTALLDRLRVRPGVEGVAAGWVVPRYLGAVSFGDQVEVRGQSIASVADTEFMEAGPDLFRILNVPLVRGRYFEDQDLNPGAPPVTIISQMTADRFFGGRDPIGQQLREVTTGGDPAPWRTVIGVVGTWKHLANYAQWRDSSIVFRPAPTSYAFLVRARGDVDSVVVDIRKEITAVEASTDAAVEPLTDRISRYLLYPRFRAGILTCFGVGALLLAAIGLHGVLAQLVSQRTQEFGVRRAVGAQSSDLLWLVFRQGGIPVLAGLATGMAVALGLTRLIRSMLYNVEPTDWRVMTGTAAVLLVASALAMTLPARRAAKVDPTVALRDE